MDAREKLKKFHLLWEGNNGKIKRWDLTRVAKSQKILDGVQWIFTKLGLCLKRKRLKTEPGGGEN